MCIERHQIQNLWAKGENLCGSKSVNVYRTLDLSDPSLTVLVYSVLLSGEMFAHHTLCNTMTTVLWLYHRVYVVLLCRMNYFLVYTIDLANIVLETLIHCWKVILNITTHVHKHVHKDFCISFWVFFPRLNI